MKTSITLVSLMAVAGAATAESASAASSSSTNIKENLRRAICFQEWDEAIELSSRLIASPAITPDHRQTLVDWRYRFSNYALDKTLFDEVPNCEEVEAEPIDIKVEAPTPKFSTYASIAPGYYCYQVEPSGYVKSLEHVCSGKASSSPDAVGGTVDLVASGSQFSHVYSGIERFSGEPQYDTSRLGGPVYNFGTRPAYNVVVKIVASNPSQGTQTRTVTIPEIAPNDSTDVAAAFNLDTDTWSVTVLSWE